MWILNGIYIEFTCHRSISHTSFNHRLCLVTDSIPAYLSAFATHINTVYSLSAHIKRAPSHRTALFYIVLFICYNILTRYRLYHLHLRCNFHREPELRRIQTPCGSHLLSRPRQARHQGSSHRCRSRLPLP